MPPVIPMIGKTFGRLTVTEFAWSNKKGADRSYRWKCICVCGNEKIVSGPDLRQGNTQTCGCRIGRVFQTKMTTPGFRICNKCEQNKEITEFLYSREKDTHRWTCKECVYAKTNKSEARKRSAEKLTQRKRDIRISALAHYGNKCVCCGETESIFLAFDHINGGGNQHRAEIFRKRYSTIAEWLVAHDYPKDFQILCLNCNWAKHANKICSHKLNQHVSMLSFGC